MPAIENLGLFVGSVLTLLLIPGPAVLYIFARSLEQGRLAGFVSILGIHVATLVHVIIAALGLSAVLASSVLAFGVIQYAGAAYLVWLGLRRICGRSQIPDDNITINTNGYWRLLRDGFVVNLLNPKTALFFLAFLPQFVDVSLGQVATQIAFLGLVYTLLGILTDGGYALAAGFGGDYLRRNRGFLTAERFVSGGLLIGLGITVAFAGNQVHRT
ncbi:LysE family translocator [Agrobacterium tumefaciens]|uniref:LysE family translocator n=1 Tax=Agrobacterium tumefaciens TaxID=358 RepID=UPI0015722728|nr:LysE family translocator [Agrobacterium tumefaciens]NSX89092.1 LysE family translocator [Agrobacterium tumefaciens]NTB97288.1 LysE family translocator [Agrobacterium tumefaciens]NTC45150.1 LysE family translocator [Agrobacterium tumefaciens]